MTGKGVAIDETAYVSPALAAVLSRFRPCEIRDLLIGGRPLVRSALVRGRRLVELRDVWGLSATAAPVERSEDDCEGR